MTVVCEADIYFTSFVVEQNERRVHFSGNGWPENLQAGGRHAQVVSQRLFTGEPGPC